MLGGSVDHGPVSCFLPGKRASVLLLRVPSVYRRTVPVGSHQKHELPAKDASAPKRASKKSTGIEVTTTLTKTSTATTKKRLWKEKCLNPEYGEIRMVKDSKKTSTELRKELLKNYRQEK